MKKVIITGATGVVGVSLIKELIQNKINVTVINRVNSKRADSIPKSDYVEVVECNIDNLLTLKDELKNDYDVFYHFAWDGTFGADRLNLPKQLENVNYTLQSVELAKELNCKTFIGAGSQSEFGHVDGVLKPYMACFPDNGYGVSKLTASLMSRIRCKELGLNHIWCRILSMYGPHDSDNSMVMGTINKMLNGEKPEFTKGEQIWDYIYSKDAARAFRLIAQKGKNNSIYCIGSGKTRLLSEYITCIRDNINPDIDLTFGDIPYYKNQVMHLQADIENLTQDTGFEPIYSFEEGIKETIQWVKEKNNR